MSIQELHTRIVKLEAEIVLQRELLKNLERDKGLAQRQLNAALDPMERLPFEISSDIFVRSLDAFPESGAHHVPMLLLNICNAWTDIALSTPSLWAVVHIIFPCARNLKKILPIWLERAQNRPLSISLFGGLKVDDDDVLSIIWEHGQQLKHLEIFKAVDEDEVEGDLEDEDGCIGGPWGNTSPGPLPLLETLTIRGVFAHPHGRWGFSLPRIFQLLALAPNLVEFRFPLGILPRTVYKRIGEALVLPKVCRLMFGEPGTCPGDGDDIIEALSLPGLEALSILSKSESVLGSDTLLSFLKRSDSPLRELVLGSCLGFDRLLECLRLLPNLRRFELWYPQYYVLERLLAALAESPSLLPYINTVVIYHREEHIHPPFWTTLSHALIARQTQLRVFRLNVSYRLSSLTMPAPDIVTTFRELAVDGTRVYISAICETWNHTFE
ncbi:hypothetical protein DFH08DRAFT_896343 [Mycena albidolilacea]|uniref:F-box domain-containing protein n=1 Tax=Mycena albidolilacea TaxID=1033008 RepID=A0AAD6ZAA4_9AGAR|nr:hypothetical protein DFH08DRAFT_896343 [Mycena albidolilacea]